MAELSCNLKSYFNIILVKPRFLLIVVIIPLVYYLYALSIPVSYEITNSVGYPIGTELYLPGSGVSTIDRDSLIRDPDILFLDSALLVELDHLITRGWNDPEDSGVELTTSIINEMSLVPFGNEELKIAYNGPQQAMGSLMVYFYSRKLVAYSRITSGSGNSSSLGGVAAAGLGSFNRNLQIRKIYRLWDNSRLYPLAVISLLSFIAMLIVVGIVEWLDSSLKSEQQAARYLDLPVLGSFPDLEELSVQLTKASEAESDQVRDEKNAGP